MRALGVHIRLTESLTQVAQRAIELEVPIFQCFLLNQDNGRFYKPTKEDEKQFLAMRNSFQDIFLHASYWINMASTVHQTHRILTREIEWAKRLGFSAVIIHPGSAKAAGTKEAGIQAIARILNKKMKDLSGVKLVLENTAHGGLTIGSDLNDFTLILNELDQPENMWFCIDTAHAYSYGYNLADDKGQDEFLSLVDKTIGFDRIAVLHLNDTIERLGGNVDSHTLAGQGHIGARKLLRFVNDPRLEHVPLIMELSKLAFGEEEKALNEVRHWLHGKIL